MRKIVFEYGAVIRAKRQEKHMKAKELAEKLDITPSFLSLIESNQLKPDGDTLLKILEILELEKNDLTIKSDPDLVRGTKKIVTSSFCLYSEGRSGLQILKNVPIRLGGLQEPALISCGS